MKPMSAWVRSVSTVTSPVFASDVYQLNSLVSDTIGLAPDAVNVAVGGPSNDLMRTACSSGSVSGKPGVK